MPDLLAWAERFVATPSVSHGGNEAIARLASELVSEIGATARLLPAEHRGVSHFTLVADFGPPAESGEGLLMLTHLDTVPPGQAALWTETRGDPFRPTERDGLLFGLGSADAKVDFVCKVAGLAQVDAAELKRPVRLVGSFGEEIGLIGARWLVHEGLTQGYRHALVGEPSELAAIRAHKGYAVFEAHIPLEKHGPAPGRVVTQQFAGAQAHSSTPHLGKNAIEAALERLAEADQRGFVALEGGGTVNQVPASCELSLVVDPGPEVTKGYRYDASPLIAFHSAWREWLAALAAVRDADFDPDHTVANLGSARLSEDRVTLTFDVRPIPGVDPGEVVAPLTEFAEIVCLRTNPPLMTSPDAPLVRAIMAAQRSLGVGERVATKATCTEAGLLANSGLDAVVIGPGTSVGNVHRPNEHTRIVELGTARDLYSWVVRELAG